MQCCQCHQECYPKDEESLQKWRKDFDCLRQQWSDFTLCGRPESRRTHHRCHCCCDKGPKLATGRFGLAWVTETPRRRACAPCGWQLEICDTPSRVESECRRMEQWAKCPPVECCRQSSKECCDKVKSCCGEREKKCCQRERKCCRQPPIRCKLTKMDCGGKKRDCSCCCRCKSDRCCDKAVATEKERKEQGTNAEKTDDDGNNNNADVSSFNVSPDNASTPLPNTSRRRRRR